ncbi:MAG: hypothetical protein P4L83_09445 [Nevskia sp.]|nr:hypothetical protein [Nevskia sp.]
MIRRNHSSAPGRILAAGLLTLCPPFAGSLAAGNVPAPPAGAPAVSVCRTYADPQETLYALHYVCTQQQLNTIFARAAAGGMPGWGRNGAGYARLVDGVPQPVEPVSRLLAGFWDGKTFYTDAHGGYLTNDLLPSKGGVSAIAGAVFFDDYPLDGRPCIHIAYPEADFAWVADYIRQVQPGVFLGMMLNRNTNLPVATFTLDFTGG